MKKLKSIFNIQPILAILAILAIVEVPIPTCAEVYEAGGTSVATDTLKPISFTHPASISPSFLVTSSTYGSNQVIGGLLTLTNAVRSQGGSATIQGVTLIDSNNPVQKIPIQIVIFDTTTLSGTYTDHTSVNINSLDIPHVLWTGTIPATSYIQTSGTLVAIATQTFSSYGLVAAGTSTNLGAILVTTATSALALSGTTTISARFLLDQK